MLTHHHTQTILLSCNEKEVKLKMKIILVKTYLLKMIQLYHFPYLIMCKFFNAVDMSVL